MLRANQQTPARGRLSRARRRNERSQMKTLLHPVAALATVILVMAGCGGGPRSSKGFVLPEGNAEKGKAAFVALQCHSCHRVEGVADLPAPSTSVARPVVIGGEVAKVKNYGELLTAIVHPSHNLSEALHKEWLAGKLSPMPQFNHVMTVEQMIDLVTFLQPRYKQLAPLYTDYPYY
jgi:mono/diheme cytochrome c family protein